MKSLGVKPYLFPVPVLMVATYSEQEQVNVMFVANGGMCNMDLVALNIYSGHKTTANIRARKAFTVAFADVNTMAAADYFGSVSGNAVPDKFDRTGLKAIRSEFVDAPIVTNFPVTMECELVEIQELGEDVRVVGRVLNTIAREDVLAGDEIDVTRLHALIMDHSKGGYYVMGEKVGQMGEAGQVFH